MKHILVSCAAAILLFACNNDKKTDESTASRSDSAASIKEKKEPLVSVETATAIKYPIPGDFQKMLTRSNGTWTGEGTMQFSADAPAVNAGTSILNNKMTVDGLYQVSEIKGNPAAGMGKPWTGVRITGYDNERKVFTRAMIGDGASAGGVSMEGTWDEATKSITMPFKTFDPSTGKEVSMKEVYRIVDKDTEVLEIYAIDQKTNKEFKMLNIKWTRKK